MQEIPRLERGRHRDEPEPLTASGSPKLAEFDSEVQCQLIGLRRPDEVERRRELRDIETFGPGESGDRTDRLVEPHPAVDQRRDPPLQRVFADVGEFEQVMVPFEESRDRGPLEIAEIVEVAEDRGHGHARFLGDLIRSRRHVPTQDEVDRGVEHSTSPLLSTKPATIDRAVGRHVSRSRYIGRHVRHRSTAHAWNLSPSARSFQEILRLELS